MSAGLVAAIEQILGEPSFCLPTKMARIKFPRPREERPPTPPHQDYKHIQGSLDGLTAWLPLDDTPAGQGRLAVAAGSHRLGVRDMPNGLLDTALLDLEWHASDFRVGDVLVFHSLAVHAAEDHPTDRVRITVDYRYQPLTEPVPETMMAAHYGVGPWDELYDGWSNAALQHYWERLPSGSRRTPKTSGAFVERARAASRVAFPWGRSTPRVLVTDHAWPSLAREREVLSAVDAELVVAPAGDDAALIELASECDAILTNWRLVPVAALDAATHCVAVTRYGIGLDNIPLERATALGIVVTNVPDFCVDEVSDHALALLLACVRRIVRFDGETTAGTWGLETARGMRRLRGQTLGLVGYGRLARAFAAKAVALGLNVRVFTPRTAPGPIEHGVVAVASLEELLAGSDVVSLHAAEHAGDPPPDRRGRVAVDEADGVPDQYRARRADRRRRPRGALDAGAIAGAALDVLDGEPPGAGHPLLQRTDVIVTPHAAFYSEEAIDDLTERAAKTGRAGAAG